MDLSVVVPAYNEEQTLESTVRALSALLGSQAHADYEIIIVNDGSADATQATAEAVAAALEGCRAISHPSNVGKGYALRQGFAAARGRLVAFIDADGEIDPKELIALLSHQETERASIVVGKKVILGFRPWHRKFMSWGFQHIGRLLFQLPVSDSQTGLKLLVRQEAQPLVALCNENGYLFDLELLALGHRQGFRISEVPVAIRILRPSRITALSGLMTLADTARLFLRCLAHRRAPKPLLADPSLPATRPGGP